jgi:WD40 repeat protein
LETASLKKLSSFKGHSGIVYCAAISPDSLRVATFAADQTAQVWDPTNGKELLTLRGHSSQIFSVAFSPDGQRIVTASPDQTARLWDARSGEELLTLRQSVAGHVRSVYRPQLR